MTARSWSLGGYTFWADHRTLVGGDPYRSLRLTPSGAAFVRDVLAGTCVPQSSSERGLLGRLVRANLLTQPTRGAVESLDATLVIPARAAASDVQRVLNSAPGLAAIVVDDGSPVALESLLQHESALRVLRNDTSLGPAAARNAGARATTTSWVVFADADLIAEAGWANELLAYTDDAVALAPRIVGADEPGLAARFERATCALDLGALPGFVSPSGRVPYVPSAALAVRRDAFVQAGGFDEAMHVGEDVDLVWRLAGAGVYYEPSVVVAHQARPTLDAALRRRAAYGASASGLAARHPRLMHHGSYPLTSALPWILAMAGKQRLAAAAALIHLALAPRTLRGLPPGAAVRAAATGQMRTSIALSRSLTRPLLPVTTALSFISKGFRRRAAFVAATGALIERRSAAAAAWQLTDDAAYSVGVWRSAIANANFSIVAPRFRLGRSKGRPND